MAMNIPSKKRSSMVGNRIVRTIWTIVIGIRLRSTMIRYSRICGEIRNRLLRNMLSPFRQANSVIICS